MFMTEVARLAPMLPGQMYPMDSQRCEHACGVRSHSRPENRRRSSWPRKHLRVGPQRKKGVSAGRSMSKMRMESLTRLTSRRVQSQRSSYTLSLSKPTIFKPSIEFTPTAMYRVRMVW